MGTKEYLTMRKTKEEILWNNPTINTEISTMM